MVCHRNGDGGSYGVYVYRPWPNRGQSKGIPRRHVAKHNPEYTANVHTVTSNSEHATLERIKKTDATTKEENGHLCYVKDEPSSVLMCLGPSMYVCNFTCYLDPLPLFACSTQWKCIGDLSIK